MYLSLTETLSELFKIPLNISNVSGIVAILFWEHLSGGYFHLDWLLSRTGAQLWSWDLSSPYL